MNKLIKYSKDEIRIFEGGKVAIAKTRDDLIRFLNNKKSVDNKTKIYLGKINPVTASKIENSVGINIENYNLSLKKDTIIHILNRHSSKKEILRGQVPIKIKDFLNIEKIVLNADNIELSGKTKQDKPIIIFEKKIKETYILVSCISDKRYNLEIKTMFKRKKEPCHWR